MTGQKKEQRQVKNTLKVLVPFLQVKYTLKVLHDKFC